MVNDIPITKGNIIAGKAIVHEVKGVLLPAEIAELLSASTTTDGSDPFADMMTGSDAAATETVLVSDNAANAANSATATNAAITVDVDTAASEATSATTTTTTTDTAAGASTTTIMASGDPVPADQRSAGCSRSAMSTFGMVALALPVMVALLA